MDPATLVHAELGPFTAGSADLVLVLEMHGLLPRVAGRVVSGSGQPLAGVRVLCERTVFSAKLELANGSQISSIGWPGPATLTDADGRRARADSRQAWPRLQRRRVPTSTSSPPERTSSG
jgi:hypothetical protein